MSSAPASATLKFNLRRPPVVVASLSVAAVLTFFAVSHLVHRFREQEKALARHLYAQGKADLDSGNPGEAVTYLRAALSYQRDEFQYQLDLSRALRDSGQTVEARSYLQSLWQRSPDDGAVNLAMGRLAAREGRTDETIHYYHNATYGIWNADAETHRRNAQFELIDFLIRQGAHPQALAELITLAASLPPDSELLMNAAQRFATLGDFIQALYQYQKILVHDRLNAAAQAGAGESAFQLHRYSTAEKYLSLAAKSDPANSKIAQSLKVARLLLQSDPFLHHISSAERSHRVQLAFEVAGDRLNRCVASFAQKAANNFSNTNPGASSTLPPDLPSLQQTWAKLKPKRPSEHIDSDAGEGMMELVFQIEKNTQSNCGESLDADQALLLLSQNRDGGDQ